MSEDISLLQFLDLSQVNCLNESSPNQTLKSILSTKARNTSESAYLLSDADEQLLLNITFNQTVRVRSISLYTRTIDQAPKLVKLFINKPSIGFEDAETASESQATQVFDLSRDEVDGRRIGLRYVRFQAVNSLHLFIGSNQNGGDETRIDAIDVFGVPVETTKDLSGLRQQEQQ